MLDDDVLMCRLQCGDESAFSELVERHQSALTGFFNRQVRDWQAAEDLSQETLMKIYGTAKSYQPRGMFHSWMYRIARNLIIDAVRRRSHDCLSMVALPGREECYESMIDRISDAVESPCDWLDRREAAATIDDQLQMIPDDQRVTFILVVYAGLSLPQVADAMQTSVSTAKSRLRLAKEKLREAAGGERDTRLAMAVCPESAVRS